MKVVIFSSPQRNQMLNNLIKELKGYDVTIINDPLTFGKKKFWMRWKQARQICLESKYDNFLLLPDDIDDLDLKGINEIFEHFKTPFACNIIDDGRKSCWGNSANELYNKQIGKKHLRHVNFFDCGGLINRKALEQFEVSKVSNKWFERASSSGVGYQLTKKMRSLGIGMYTALLCSHGEHDSVMHPNERKITPLTCRRMKVVVGIATFKGREETIKKTIQSLAHQVDEIRIYDNEKRDINLTDNGKFYFLQEYDKPVYYFSCDDDIIYPPTYVQDMIQAIEKHKCIVTHHGRILRGKGLRYYTGHKAFQCLKQNNAERLIDVAGTGVTAFDTSYFNPLDIWKSEDKRMSDLVFSLEAKKQGKKIVVLPHGKYYFEYQHIPLTETIHGLDSLNDFRQSELADLILSL